MKRPMICFYHSDMDGLMAASVVKRYYNPKHYDIRFVPVNYGDSWRDYYLDGRVVVVVDFSFDDMVALEKNCNHLIWIDHHKSAMEKQSDIWNSRVEGIRLLDRSGCELAYKYFFPMQDVPKTVLLVGDRDLWKFRYGDETRWFHEWLKLTFTNPKVGLVDMTESKMEKALEIGSYLYQKKKKDIVKNSFGSGFNIDLMGYACRVVNAPNNISDTADYNLDFNRDGEKIFDVILLWHMNSYGDVICSLRSRDVDVGRIAVNLGGGGHKFAAGFRKDLDFLMRIYKDQKV